MYSHAPLNNGHAFPTRPASIEHDGGSVFTVISVGLTTVLEMRAGWQGGVPQQCLENQQMKFSSVGALRKLTKNCGAWYLYKTLPKGAEKEL